MTKSRAEGDEPFSLRGGKLVMLITQVGVLKRRLDK